MSLRSEVGRIRRQVLSRVYQRIVPLNGHGPIITVTFDDFPLSALTMGAHILETFGARATYYVAMSLMNRRNELGEQFRKGDLDTLVERGHEIASHTFNHLSARQVSYDLFQQDVRKGEQAIKDEIGLQSYGNFAYPYGHATLVAKKRLGPQLISCRGTCAGLNGPNLDLNLLRANNLYGGLDRAEAIRRLIIENARRNSWLILYTHDVAARPSPFGCTPELLETTCSFAVSCKTRFKTVDQVMKELETIM